MNDPRDAILFYDGECGLCQRSVQFLLRRDRGEVLYFAPIQGVTAQQYLSAHLRTALSSVIYLRPTTDGQPAKTLLRSDAVLCALIDMHTAWRYPAYLARCIPLTWRDAIYQWIANNRDRLWRRQTCLRPNPKQSKRLLP
ncbi:DCC1-like thiol-disulfide oxidoreductase family protein [Coraliomargarita sp. SDUM461003]|uniref:DCC1-like thiol-disulfide oxidoreductase family protein n=1 Tax=Thalassobacterium maritimum TaxID=3041265 RepID=A0ABU1ARL6_9BACT|nr:DCC1-like thiol-disulfide oxidoreductase family protein [Coraliomargarita sp. SDUM461003]MDQ8206801.1 DCC1-like thiol-disulfide oxidoreductase family protein [Coraliomargarita sp. SDUM461003]